MGGGRGAGGSHSPGRRSARLPLPSAAAAARSCRQLTKSVEENQQHVLSSLRARVGSRRTSLEEVQEELARLTAGLPQDGAADSSPDPDAGTPRLGHPLGLPHAQILRNTAFSLGGNVAKRWQGYTLRVRRV